MNAKLIKTHNIADSLASALMRLGRNDLEAVLWHIDKAREQVTAYQEQHRAIKIVERLIAGEVTPQEAVEQLSPAQLAYSRDAATATGMYDHDDGG